MPGLEGNLKTFITPAMAIVVLFSVLLTAADTRPVAGTKSAKSAAVRVLIDVGTLDGTFLVTIKNGVVKIENANVVTIGTTVTLPTNPTDPTDPTDPVDPPVIIPTDPAKAFTDAIEKVTESGKVKTAEMLKSAIDPVLAAATKGELIDFSGVKDNLPFTLSLLTMSKADWTDFQTAIKTHVGKSVTVAEFIIVLKAASNALGKVK